MSPERPAILRAIETLVDDLADLDIELSRLEPTVAGRARAALARSFATLTSIADHTVRGISCGDVVVTPEHYQHAVALVAAHLDGGTDDTALLAEVVESMSVEMATDATYRVTVLSAMAQLAADALVAAVAVWPEQGGVPDDNPALLHAGCRELLSRIALIHAT